MKEPDEVDEIKEFISCKYHQNSPEVTKNEYLKDFNDAYSVWKNSKEKKDKIIEELKKVIFVGCINKDRQFCIKQHKPSFANYDYQGNPWSETSQIIYFHDEILKSWFDGNVEDNYFFLISELTDEKYRGFLTALGVQKTLFFDYNLCFEFNRRAHYKRGVDEFNPNLNLHGLKFAIANVNLVRSIFFWKTLLDFGKFQLFRGRLESRKNKDHEWQKGEDKSSKLMELINDNYWLYDKDENLIERSLSEIRVDLLHDGYDHSHKNSVKLFEALGLIHDAKQQELAAQVEEANARAAEAEAKAVEEKKRREEAEAGRLEAEQKAEAVMRKAREQGVSLDESNVNSSDINLDLILTLDDKIYIDNHVFDTDENPIQKQEPKGVVFERQHKTKSPNSYGRPSSSKNNNQSSIKRKQTGDEGEYYAEIWLRKHYGEKIINCNKQGKENNEAFDFILPKDNVAFDFISLNDCDVVYYWEIKTRQNKNETFTVTKAQWDFATYLHEEKKEGDKYYFLIVTLDTEDVKPLCNPVKMLRDDHELKAEALELSWKDEG